MTTAPETSTDQGDRKIRHLGAGAALSVVSDVATLTAAAVVSVVLARVIGPSANGTYALLLTVMNIAVLVVSLGVASGITYQVSHGKWDVGRAFRTTFRAALVLGLSGVAGSLVFYALSSDTVMRSVDLPLAVIASAAIPAALALQFAAAILLGRERYESYAGLQLTNAALILVGSAGLALVFGVTGAVVGMTTASVLTAFAAAWLLRRWTRARGPAARAGVDESGTQHLALAFRFGIQAWLGNLLQQANYRFDLLILAAYAAASHVGVYSVAVTITEIAWILPHGLQTVLFPRASKLQAAAGAREMTEDETNAAVARATRNSVLLVVPAGLTVAVLLALVPIVYGSKFAESVGLGFILLPGVLVLGVGKVLGSVVAGRGRPRYMLYSGALGAAVTIILYLVLIPRYHEWGASAASSVSYVLTMLIVLYYFRRLTRIRLRTALVPTRADVRNYFEAVAALRLHLGSRRTQRTAA
jgi:O-antigen/teichoic acid export membrane protein